MGVDFESFQDVLKHPIRRKIILALSENQNFSYMDLMGIVEAENTGKFNYHLKILADLIQKDENGKYGLTEKGRLAAQFLKTFKEKKIESSRLRMADALLIGFAGFVLTLGNPGFLAFMVAASTAVKSIPLFLALRTLVEVFAIILPGALMWRLAVRRSHSHDPYDLYKAPFFAFVMLLPLFIILLIFQVEVGTQVTIQVGQTVIGQTVTGIKYTMIGVNLTQIVLYGLVCSFLGVSLSELASRVRKKLALRR